MSNKSLHVAALLPLLLLLVAACNSNEPNPGVSIAENKTAKLYCSDSLHPEMPVGNIVFINPDSIIHSISTIDIGKDTIKWFTYEKDALDSSKYVSVEIISMAIKDIDPAGLEVTEGDLDMNDGSKLHITGFFIRAINEEKRFKCSAYTCQNQIGNKNDYDAHTCNISTTNIEIAKQMVEKIKPLLIKKP